MPPLKPLVDERQVLPEVMFCTLQNSEQGVVNVPQFAVKVVCGAPLPFHHVSQLEFRDAVVASDKLEHDQHVRCLVEVILTIDDLVEVWILRSLSMGVG
jgi:hypothetical protein